MRPSLIDPLFAEASHLPGIGPKTARHYLRLLKLRGGMLRVIDLLFHLPIGVIDRRARPTIAAAEINSVVTLTVRVVEHQPPPPRTRVPYRVLVEDDTGDCLLIFFLSNHEWIEKALPKGVTRYVSGKLELWDGYRQMVHPDQVMDEAGLARMDGIEPVYPLTEGLFARAAIKAARAALARVPQAMPEWLDEALLARRNWPDFTRALTLLHRPGQAVDVLPDGKARTRLAYDELLAQQLALLLVRRAEVRPAGRALNAEGLIAARIIKALPYEMTGAQNLALAEIAADLKSDHRMMRLLQGDVGSGKTIVAFLAMALVAEAGHQAALMAPTEILARQHFDRLKPMAEAAGLRLACLTGRDKGAGRARLLVELANGSVDLVIGTHALFQNDIEFHDLALAVVDEQHRFGVEQRLALGTKGGKVDVLAMTATPIPRTLVLTHFGDMDVSLLREKPTGRTPIQTSAIPDERLGEVVEGLARALKTGARVYWICPLVHENEELDLAAATERFASLGKIFGADVGLIHGQMPARDKDAAMAAFQAGSIKILVATIVVEVGVDVPEASIMVIEHAERFGLAQLHQLRGRVGRGLARSSCVLLYHGPLGEMARKRLKIMRETEDGFRIAEEDLALRGEGEILGTRQAGLPNYRVADLEVHHQLLEVARDDAKLILARDPRLESLRGQALRVLLHLFERREAIRLMQAG